MKSLFTSIFFTIILLGTTVATFASEETPAPIATPTMQNRPARVLSDSRPKADALTSGYSGIVVVNVELSDSGAVQAISLLHSSGNNDLAVVAMSTALHRTYAPAVVNGKPVSGFYEFRVKFVGN